MTSASSRLFGRDQGRGLGCSAQLSGPRGVIFMHRARRKLGQARIFGARHVVHYVVEAFRGRTNHGAASGRAAGGARDVKTEPVDLCESRVYFSCNSQPRIYAGLR